ncbi:MAG: ribosomal protein [Candidatus Midichloriaceae bacterium]|jgi:large subunit ribosomal protein L29|nr:ribosomal protein [Candidatus Midichloriaceae bacterium]
MKVSDLRKKTNVELKQDLLLLQRERMNLRFQKAAKEAISTARVKVVRKSIARIKTILNEIKVRGSNA